MLECSKCSATFASATDRNNHFKKTHATNIKCVDKCGSNTLKVGAHLDIYRVHRNDEGLLICSQCAKAFEFPGNLQRHTKLCSNNSANANDVDDRSLSDSDNVSISNAFASSFMVLNADECFVENLLPLSLRFNSSLGLFICLHCDQGLSPGNLLNHLSKFANLKMKKVDFDAVIDQFATRPIALNYSAISSEVQPPIAGLLVYLSGASCRLCLHYTTSKASMANHIAAKHAGSPLSTSHDILPLQKLGKVLFKVLLPQSARPASALSRSQLHPSLQAAFLFTTNHPPEVDLTAREQSSFFLNSGFRTVIGELGATNMIRINSGIYGCLWLPFELQAYPALLVNKIVINTPK